MVVYRPRLPIQWLRVYLGCHVFDLGITQVQPRMQSAPDGMHTCHHYQHNFDYHHTNVIFRGWKAAEQICTCGIEDNSNTD